MRVHRDAHVRRLKLRSDNLAIQVSRLIFSILFEEARGIKCLYECVFTIVQRDVNVSSMMLHFI